MSHDKKKLMKIFRIFFFKKYFKLIKKMALFRKTDHLNC